MPLWLMLAAPQTAARLRAAKMQVKSFVIIEVSRFIEITYAAASIIRKIYKPRQFGN